MELLINIDQKKLNNITNNFIISIVCLYLSTKKPIIVSIYITQCSINFNIELCITVLKSNIKKIIEIKMKLL